MSEIQNLGQYVSKLIADSNASAARLYNLATGIKRITETTQQLLQQSSQRNYQNIINQMHEAQHKLTEAASSLVAASDSAEEWLRNHVGSGTSSPGITQIDSPSFSSGQGTAPEKTPFDALRDYMFAHNYGKQDFATYSQDPEWRVLYEAAFPDSTLPPIAQATAYALLVRYMSENNYGPNDFETYSQNPIWQELHKYAFPAPFVRPDPASSSEGYATITAYLNQENVGYKTIQLYGQMRTTDEIIRRLGGGDNTAGSCSSLAFAYAGNVAGYDVLDFRDGRSREFFSKNSSIEKIASLPGVDSRILRGRNDLLCVNDLLNSMIQGKEYYLATGEHAAIVRKVEDHFEYLELQHPTNNGWHTLDDSILLRRFHCEKFNAFKCPNFLIDVSSLAENQEFLGILGYLNTSESEQHKGENGRVR